MSRMHKCFLCLFLLFLILPVRNVYAYAYDVEDGSCYGYATDICSLAKQEHEMGAMLQLGLPEKSATVKAYEVGLAFVYQNNVNSYFSVHTEFGAGALLAKTPLIYGLSANLGTGVRAYPWKQWFYMGAGLTLRGMFALDEFNTNLNLALIDALTVQLYAFMELGFSFPARGSTFDINIKFRQDLLTAFGFTTFSHDFDPIAKMPVTFGLGINGLFGKLGALPAENAYDALTFVRDQDAYMTFSNVFFDSESTVLSTMAEAQIQNILKLAKNYNPSLIVVRAYGDIQDKNIRKQQKVANARAQNVLEYLVSLGVHKDKIIAIGVPAKRSTTQALKERNQRLEIVLVRS